MTNRELVVQAKHVVMKNLAEIRPDERNPRKMDDAERQKLENSLLEFGLVEPFVVNEDGKLIGGHQRYFVILDLVTRGEIVVDAVPVVVFTGDAKKQKLLNIALNKISGRFDYEQLAGWVLDEVDDPSDLENLTLTGFTSSELSALSQATEQWFDKLSQANDQVGDITQLAAFSSGNETDLSARKVGNWILRYANIPVNLLDPNDFNPQTVKPKDFEALKTSIKTLGLLRAILVRPHGDRYQILDGEQRWQACRELGWAEMPCQVTDADDAYAKVQSLVANQPATGTIDATKLLPTLNKLRDEMGEAELQNLTGYDNQEDLPVLDSIPELSDIDDLDIVADDDEPRVELLLNLAWSQHEFIVNVLRQLSDDPGKALMICCKACVRRMKDGTTDEVKEEMGCDEKSSVPDGFEGGE